MTATTMTKRPDPGAAAPIKAGGSIRGVIPEKPATVERSSRAVPLRVCC